jgi:Zincin-like metallopeptidase
MYSHLTLARDLTTYGFYCGPVVRDVHTWVLGLVGGSSCERHPERPQTAAGDADRLRREVRHVVLHEIAHHFGISDERLIELDRY